MIGMLRPGEWLRFSLHGIVRSGTVLRVFPENDTVLIKMDADYGGFLHVKEMNLNPE